MDHIERYCLPLENGTWLWLDSPEIDGLAQFSGASQYGHGHSEDRAGAGNVSVGVGVR